MAETSGPWDDNSGDRTYTAAQVAAFWGNMTTGDGVVLGKLNSLTPSNDQTLSITLATGYCYKSGVYYYNSSAYKLSLNACTSGYKRIDYLVIRYDPTTTRSAFAYVISGVATTSTPSAPSTSSTDIPIATILIDNSTGTYAYTVTDMRQSLQVPGLASILVNGKIVGERFFTGSKLTPGVTCPVVARYDANHDITASGGTAGTNAPLLVALYRAEAASIPTSGTFYSSWSVTVSGSTVTFGAGGDGLLAAIAADALVSGFLNTNQSASTFAVDFSTAATQLYINIAGTDYAITGESVGSRTLTVNGTPTTGSQTAIFYPYRTASTSTIRLRRLSGFVQAVAGDYDGEVIAGLRCMDRTQGHNHNLGYGTPVGTGGITAYNNTIAPVARTNLTNAVGDPITDGTNGAARTGKTTSPRSAGGYLYEWAGVLV
jgi:hypothetical protein